MDILKLMGSLEIEAKDEEQLSKFLNEKESEIKGTILALWQKFSDENASTVEDKDAIIINEESSIKAEKADEMKEFSKIEDKNKLLETSDNIELVLIQDKNTIIAENKTETEPEKTEQIQDKNTTFYESQIKNKSIIIPNGKVNQDYCYAFKIEELV